MNSRTQLTIHTLRHGNPEYGPWPVFSIFLVGVAKPEILTGVLRARDNAAV